MRMVFWSVAMAAAATMAVAWAQVPQGAGTPVSVAAKPVVAPAVGGVQKPAVALAADPLAIQPFDRVEGNPSAPMTMIEYVSMTCSHCADFALNVMPDVRREWVATGKMKLVMRDLPWDNLALGMSKVARCAPPAQFYPLTTAMFRAQEEIIRSKNPLEEIKRIGRLAGMDGPKVESCVRDMKLHTLVTGMRDVAQKQLKVTGTPTLFINGTRVNGAPTEYKDLKPILDKVYAGVQASGGLTR